MMRPKLFLNVFAFILLIPTLASGNYDFLTQDGQKGVIELVEKREDVDQAVSRDVLIDSFIHEYRQYLEPNEVDANSNVWFADEGEPLCANDE